jgi:hypothetical protein
MPHSPAFRHLKTWYKDEEGYILHVYTTGGEKEYTLHVHIAYGEDVYTLHVHTSDGVGGYTLHVNTSGTGNSPCINPDQ